MHIPLNNKHVIKNADNQFLSLNPFETKIFQIILH